MPATTRTIFQLPNVGTWYENVAVRSSGTVLGSRLDKPELTEIDPATGKATALVEFPSPNNALTGITELTPDVFAIGAGQYSQEGGNVDGSWGLWTVDLSAANPEPKQVVQLPEIGLLNGITTFDSNTVLIADSTFGALWRVDVSGKSAAKITALEEMSSPEGAPFQIGMNGIKVHDGALYWTNTTRGRVYRAALGADASLSGKPEEVFGVMAPDDLCIAPDGTIYATSHMGHTVVAAAKGAKEASLLAGNAETLEIGGPTACALGRGKDEGKVLYVVTSGALAAPVKGELKEPAKVVAVELA
jgi:hypothetical protein